MKNNSTINKFVLFANKHYVRSNENVPKQMKPSIKECLETEISWDQYSLENVFKPKNTDTVVKP